MGSILSLSIYIHTHTYIYIYIYIYACNYEYLASWFDENHLIHKNKNGTFGDNFFPVLTLKS